MPARWKTVIILILLASASAWLLNKLTSGESTAMSQIRHDPDYYMENFTTWTMEEDGNPKNILTADYMAHYPDSDALELVNPRLEVYRKDKLPVRIIADKGWVTDGNEVILLTGNVRLWEEDAAGNKKLEIISTDVRILPDQEYAETDNPARLIRGNIITNATGLRAWMKESRLELLGNVQTIISPEEYR
jgi:lipopolysaccharide export system protein LptC